MRKLVLLTVCATVIGVGFTGVVQASSGFTPAIVSLTVTSPDPRYACGNLTGDEQGRIDLVDIFALISYIYLNGDPPLSPEIANVDGSPDGKVNLSDIIRLLSHVYLGVPELDCGCCIHRDARSICTGISFGIPRSGWMWAAPAGSDLYVHR